MKHLVKSAFVATLLVARSASADPAPAQPGTAPDPFRAYESSNPDVPPVKEVAVPAPPAQDDAGDASVPTARGTLSLGGLVTFDYAGSNLESLDGSSVSNSNFFARAGARGSYMITDRLDVGGTLGLLWRDAGRGASQTGGFLEANVGYLAPLAPKFALAPRLGLGIYRGGAERDLVVNGNVTTESTSVTGLTATAYLLGAFQISPSVQVRSGLALTALAGWESVGSADRTLSSTSFFVGIPVEVDWTRSGR